MALVNRNSTAIADMVAVPKVAVAPTKGAAGRVFEACGYVANAANDDANSVARFCRVPSNARVTSVKLTTGDATTAGNIDIGLYKTADNGGAVVDADLFASALALTGGPFINSEQILESGVYTVDEMVKPLWAVLGLSADPCIEYDVAATITTTYDGAAVGQFISVQYVI